MRDYVHGTFNAAKCVRYLRSIGVEISEELAAEWGDAERADRAIRRIVARGVELTCTAGHTIYVERKGRSRKGGPKVCPRCGAHWRQTSSRWLERGDGLITDLRHRSERWKDLKAPPPGELP